VRLGRIATRAFAIKISPYGSPNKLDLESDQCEDDLL